MNDTVIENYKSVCESLQIENKALKEKLEWALDYELQYKKQIKTLQDSRDELLSALFELMTKAELLISNFSNGKAARVYNAIILKAEALKEKEA